jgi:C4-dicarboxylate transporter
MENIFNMVTDFFGKMTSLFMGLLSFGIIAEVLFGKAVLGMSVIDNVMALISTFGDNGVVGLIALVILYNLLDRK